MGEFAEHALTVKQRKRIEISGVSEVKTVGQERIVLAVSGGKSLLIVGTNLKLGAFNNQTGNLCIDGTINEIKYFGEKTSFIKKLLK